MERTLEKRFETPKDKLVIGVTADGKAKQENSGYQRGNRNGVLAADIFDVNRVSSNEGSWDAHDRGDSIVAIYYAVRRRVCIRFPNVLVKLGEKGIEKRVPHSNCCPAKPDEACCDFTSATYIPSLERKSRQTSQLKLVRTHDSQTPRCEKRGDPIFRELAKRSFHNICMRELGLVNHSWVTANGVQNLF